MGSTSPRPLAFLQRRFASAARKAGIGDTELLAAVRQVMLGQADDLGGGVFKKRLSQNRQRSIVLAGGEGRWVFAYLFDKQNRANINAAELAGFRKLAKAYRTVTDLQLAALLAAGDLEEIDDATA